jgi:vacuolar-type H+-ATPase subunit H
MAEDATLRRADELLAEMIELVETARNLPMSASCVLPRERMLDLLDELRDVLPPELDESRKVVAARDSLLHNAFTDASETRQRAAADADTIIADAEHRAAQTIAAADERAQDIVADAEAEQARLVAASTVHQAAAAASERLRAEAESYRDAVCGEADEYDRRVRLDADRYAREARAEAERYATKLTADADTYAENTLDELAATLRKAAATADQGRFALSERRSRGWDGAGAAEEQDIPA